MRIIGVPEIEVEMDVRLIEAFQILCGTHYCSRVKSLVSVYNGAWGNQANGPITIAANRLLSVTPTFENPNPELNTELRISLHQADLMLKAMEQRHQLLDKYIPILDKFDAELRDAFKAIESLNWSMQL